MSKSTKNEYKIKHLGKSQSDTEILKIYKDNNYETMKIKNHDLQNKINSIYNIINVSYTELQNIRKEPLMNIPMGLKLKELIVWCGQYYANFCNEHQKYLLAMRKNELLSKKIANLESNIQNLTEELNTVKNQNLELNKEPGTNRSSKINCTVITSGTFSENKLKILKDVKCTSLNKNNEKWKKDLNLNSHISLVKKLLLDQDKTLKELKNFCNELKLK